MMDAGRDQALASVSTQPGEITDEGIDALRARIGTPMRHLARDAVVSQEWIDRFAYGIGDINPLWSDPLYAARTSHGSTIAPPAMVFVLGGWDVGTGLPGVHGLYTGCEIEWARNVFCDEVLHSTGHLCAVDEKHGEFAGRMVLQGTETTFENAAGATVAVMRNYNLRTSRRVGRERRASDATRAVDHASYTEEELAQIEIEILRSEIRGDLPRTSDDVEVGAHLVPVVKGPLTTTDVVAWMRTGFGGVREGMFLYPHEFATIWRRRHPAAVMRTPWGYVDSPESVHWDDGQAQAAGAPAAYDIGPQRISWMCQTITNWMGDDAALKQLSVRLKKFVAMGDTVWSHGVVTEKTENLVAISLTASNQRGEVVGTGRATVALPTGHE